jgi:hypothetical protein
MSNGEDQQPPGEQPESQTQPEEATDAGSDPQPQRAAENAGINGMIDQAIMVVTNPVGFYRSMPKGGGYSDPLVFMIVLAVASGVITAVLSVFGIGVRGAMMGGFAAIVLVPIFVTIFGFIGAAIVHVIWKLMGSGENYETSYRCVAYSSAVGPVVTVLGIIPSIGSIVSAVWPMVLMAIASIVVHSRGEKLSWAVFGALTMFLVVINLASEQAANDMTSELENVRRMMEQNQ